jgi:hypothetical protein
LWLGRRARSRFPRWLKQKENMKKLQLAILAVGLAGTMSASATIVELITNPTGQAGYNDTIPWSMGFEFSTPSVLNTPTVTQLGFYDYGNNGLGAAHDVALFAADGTRLAHATVSAGGAATADSYQWVNITPVNLVANTTYYLAAYYSAPGGGADPDWLYLGSATVAPGFSVLGSYYSVTSSGTDATWNNINYSGPPNGFHGPDLRAVPEPTTMIAGALLLLPFGASTLRILRRTRTA